MELLYKGAEASIWRTDYLGMPAVVKERIAKTYRIPEIDEKIRKARIKKEVLMIVESQKAVNTPKIFDVNMKEMKITMQFINGKKVRDLFYEGKDLEKTAELIGKSLKKLHTKGIIHNDLTTSNMILKNGEIYFIDFGLAQTSSSTEDKAVDVLVFKKMLKSTHWKYYEKIWAAFEKAYAEKTVLNQVKEVEKRARYAEQALHEK